MIQLIIVPLTGEVFAYEPEAQLLTGFDNEQFGLEPNYNWQRLKLKEPIPSIEAWQADPGKYSTAHYVHAQITAKDGTQFTVGGSFAYVTSETKANYKSVQLLRLFNDRNLARKNVEVQW